MKQHITAKQLNELSGEGKEKLREWWKPQEGDWLVNKAIHPKSGKKHEIELCMSSPTAFVWKPMINKALPLLSIGQMIEFLDGYSKKAWGFMINHPWQTSTLCDELWKAVKEILK